MKVGDLVRMRKGYGDTGVGLLYKVVPSRSGIKQFIVMWSDATLMAISAAIIERVR